MGGYSLEALKKALQENDIEELMDFSTMLANTSTKMAFQRTRGIRHSNELKAKIASEKDQHRKLLQKLAFRTTLKNDFQLFSSKALAYVLQKKQYNIRLKNITTAMMPNKFKDNMIVAREISSLNSKVQDAMDKIKVCHADIQVVQNLIDLYEAGIQIKSLEAVPGITQKILNLELANEMILNTLKGIVSESAIMNKDLEISKEKIKEEEAASKMIKKENSYLLGIFDSIVSGNHQAVVEKLQEDINEYTKDLKIKEDRQVQVRSLKEANVLYAEVGRELEKHQRAVGSVNDFLLESTEQLNMKNEILAKEMKVMVEKAEKIKNIKRETEELYQEHEKYLLEVFKKKSQMSHETLKLIEKTRLATKEIKEKKRALMYDILIVFVFTLISGGIFLYAICKELYLQGKKILTEDKE